MTYFIISTIQSNIVSKCQVLARSNIQLPQKTGNILKQAELRCGTQHLAPNSIFHCAR